MTVSVVGVSATTSVAEHDDDDEAVDETEVEAEVEGEEDAAKAECTLAFKKQSVRLPCEGVGMKSNA